MDESVVEESNPSAACPTSPLEVRTNLQRFRKEIIAEMDTALVLSSMLEEGCFSGSSHSEDYKTIINQPGRKESNRLLLRYVLTQGSAVYECFLRSLAKSSSLAYRIDPALAPDIVGSTHSRPISGFVQAVDALSDIPEVSPFLTELYDTVRRPFCQWSWQQLARILHIDVECAASPQEADRRQLTREVLVAWSLQDGDKATAEALVLAVHNMGDQRLAEAMAKRVKGLSRLALNTLRRQLPSNAIRSPAPCSQLKPHTPISQLQACNHPVWVDVCTRLDSTAIGENWRGLCQRLKMQQSALDRFAKKESPTSAVLNEWVAFDGSSATVLQLLRHLQSMHHNGLVECFGKYLSPLALFQSRPELHEEEPTCEELLVVSEKVIDARQLMVHLGLDHHDIQACRMNNPYSITVANMSMLTMWKQRLDNFSLLRLVQGLECIGHADVAKEILAKRGIM